MEKDFKHTIEEIDDQVTTVPRVNGSSVFGMYQTVSVVPTTTPLFMQNQIQIYSNAGTFRIYIYDTVSNTWKYSALT